MRVERGFKWVDALAIGAIALVVIGKFLFPGYLMEFKNLKEPIANVESSSPYEEQQLKLMKVEVVEAGNQVISETASIEVQKNLSKNKKTKKISDSKLSEIDSYLISDQGLGLFGSLEDGRHPSGLMPVLGKDPTELEVESHDFARRDIKSEW